MPARGRACAHEPGVRLVWMRQAEAPFRWPLGLTVHRDIACKNNSRLRLWVKSSLGLLRWQDRHRDGVLLDAADLQHERAAAISYFMVLRRPSQSVAPLKAFGLRKCPSCTTSTQPPADRLTV